MTQHYSLIPSTIIRTLILWFLSNLGGTLLLGFTLALDQLDDCTIALLTGLIAALVSLPLIPLAIPFLAVLGHLQPGWSRRSMALLGVGLFFLLANQLLLFFLPFLSLGSLLSMGLPYLAAALGVIFWLYSSAGQHYTSSTDWLGQWARSRSVRVLRMFGRETTPPAI